jgi:hypothetical protein
MFLQRSMPFILTILLAACQPVMVNTPVPQVGTEVPSPVPPASPSPSATPAAPTEALAPVPRLFTEQFDGILPYWTFEQIDNGQAASDPFARSGFLVFDLNGPNQWVYALYSEPAYTDIRVDAHADVLAGEGGAFGVVCRYGEEQGWYEFNIYADQTYELLFGQWLAQGMARYTPLVRGTSEKIKSDADQIGLLCEGSTLTPFINGVQMRSWQDNRFGLKEGKIGLSAASFESVPFTIGFDWFKGSEP